MATKTNHTEIAPEVDLDGSPKLTVSAQERVVRHDSRVSQATEYFNQLFQINLIRNEHPSLWASRGYYCYNWGNTLCVSVEGMDVWMDVWMNENDG